MKVALSRLDRATGARRQRWARNQQALLDVQQQLAQAQAELLSLQQQAEQQRQASATQLHLLLNTLPTGVLAETPQRRVALVNQQLCELLGLPDAASLPGALTAAVLQQAANPPLAPDDFIDWMEQTVATHGHAPEATFELTNGRVVQLHYLPLHHGTVVALHLWNYEDVTAQHRAQRRIQQLSELAEHSPNPVLTVDAQGQIRYCNTAAEPVSAALGTAEGREAAGFLRRTVAEALTAQRARTAEHPLGGHFYIWTVVPLPQRQQTNVYLTDISVRRRAEAELRRSQHLLARINDTLPTLVFVYDMVQRRLLYANDQVEQMLGYSAAQLQHSPEAGHMRHFFHPDDVPVVQERLSAYDTLADGGLLETEARFRHRDGSWRWLQLKVTVFNRDDNGRVRQVVGSAEDITERRRAIEALDHSRRFLAQVANTVPDVIYLYDLQRGRNLYINQQITTLLGYPEDGLQAMGDSMFEQIVYPDDQPVLNQHRLRLLAAADGELLQVEYRMLHHNGSFRWLRLRESVFARDQTGRPREIVGSAEDVTQVRLDEAERQQARARTAEQSRLVRQVIDSVPHLVYLKDAAGRYVLANQATADLFGRSVEQVLGHTMEELHTDPANLPRYRQQDREIILTGAQLEVEETFLRPDGQVLCFHSIKRPFVQDDGSVLVLGVDSNITELKRAQQALRAAKDAAEENARVKQEFLANMSHEVRTPLNGIIGMAGLLAKSPLDHSQSHYLALMRQSADHLLVLINDMLSAAQLASGKLRLEYIPFDLHALLRDTLESQQLRAAEKGIELRLELPEAADRPVLGDPHRLRQIVLNLLGNALKFTSQGQVTLRGEWVQAGRANVTFHLAVQDTGIGIESRQLAAIFEPFTQASASTAREFGGSGLGLSISRGLVELLGGHIWAESAPGQGSTFHVELPLPPAQGHLTTGPDKPGPEPALPPCRVLLAEDNAVNQLLAATLLRSWGAQVDTALNGLEALERFDERRYDVVLMDIQMPGMDGMTAAGRMRQHPDPTRARTPIVALTAHALPGEAARCRQAGFAGYVSKPFREDDLLAALQQSLGATASAAAPPAEPPAPAPFDLSPLRHLAAGDAGFLRRLADLFVRSTPPVLEQMLAHLEQQDWDGLSADAHFLKSSVGGVGLQFLLPSLRELEALGKPGAAPDATQVQLLVEQVYTTFARVIEQLRREYLGA
ncbi:PAS domain S-box protein [Hymenobacter sp. CRA2]|uniref:PAS domain S-box protein n=1 Tax=Hymenobacter sp. CRA2 TaxID=1955620 RepID=UPI00098F8278|nr:PAS domain S-box protein [Hymenobacter sp. CRA2]OON67794.1 hypothetical protein B0919_16545 [Hymenobacter sp. CRA2]